jgi:hypothetical protein
VEDTPIEEEKLLDAGEGDDEGTVDEKDPSPPTTRQNVKDDDDDDAVTNSDEEEPELPDVMIFLHVECASELQRGLLKC